MPTPAACRMGGWLHYVSLALASVPPAPHTAVFPSSPAGAAAPSAPYSNVTFLSGRKQVTFLMARDIVESNLCALRGMR